MIHSTRIVPEGPLLHLDEDIIDCHCLINMVLGLKSYMLSCSDDYLIRKGFIISLFCIPLRVAHGLKNVPLCK